MKRGSKDDNHQTTKVCEIKDANEVEIGETHKFAATFFQNPKTKEIKDKKDLVFTLKV